MTSEIYENEDGKFIVFPNDAIAQHLKQNRLWEPHFIEVVKVFIEPGATVIDAGANFGYNSVLMGKQISTNGLLVSFEPQRIIYQQLCGNLILNNIYNAVVYQAALGDGSQKITNMRPVEYQAPWVNIGDTSVGEDGEEVAIYTLDEIGLETVSFIKMDVQGYELFALQGAENILTNQQPDLFIEVEPHQLVKFGVTENQLLDYIKSFGYSIYKINNEYPCDHVCTVNNLDKINLLGSILPLVQV
jgi:FkbM family methyltransferase